MTFDKSRVKVLIIDDEESIRTMIGTTLKEEGWNVELAANGKLGLEALNKSSFHIVMSDIQMPEMTGIEVLEAVKKKNINTEFLVMTSNATLETALKAIKLGAYDYLTKPFEDLTVISKKMTQVAEKILLRQQNNELIKRLRKAGQDLKSLFEMASELNGVLDEPNLQKVSTAWPAKIFQDPTVRAFWFEKNDKWKCIHEVSQQPFFQSGETFDDVNAIKAKLSSLRSVREVAFEYDPQLEKLFAFESLSNELADMISFEIQTCFEKVMQHQDVVSLANRDGVTRLYNHRYFQDRLRQELAQVKRQNGDLSVILIDVDHFKQFNDTYGHPAGDQLLKELAQVLDQECARRDSDIVARYGGEEFVFILPFTDFNGAMVKAERIRDAIEKHTFGASLPKPLGKVTASLGVATFPQHAVSPTALVELADKALYQAKGDGRNRVAGYDTKQIAPSVEPRATLGSVLDHKEPIKETTDEIPAPVVVPKVETPATAPAPVLAPTPTSELPPVSDLHEMIDSVVQEPVANEAPAKVIPPAPVQTAPAPVENPVAPAPAPTPTSAPMKSPKKMKRKPIGPEVDIDDLFSSIEAVIDQPTANDAEIKTVLFNAEKEVTKPKEGKNGTGTQG